MNLSNQAHDIGIAFATVKMQARIADSNDDSQATIERQILEFIDDYTFALTAFLSNSFNF